MINQLIQFTRSIPEEKLIKFDKPKTGLHIQLAINTSEDGQQSLDENKAIIERWDGKEELSEFLLWCTDKTNLSWNINTNKCFDLPAKGIHSCSPYCVAFKKESLAGGAKHAKDKTKIYDRFEAYFTKAFELLENEADQQPLILWKNFFTDSGRLTNFLNQQEELLKLIKDGEYIVFYLLEDRSSYQSSHKKYLSNKLFNTDDYTIAHPSKASELLGTNDFKNGFNSKKPYLEHQSAPFKITGRISSSDAAALYQFERLMRYRVFPTPLPIFVNEAERQALQQSFFELATLDFDGKNRPSHTKVMSKLLEKEDKKISNYYLLYHSMGEIIDFDFVPKFEYKLRTDKDRPWLIQSPFFKENKDTILSNVFDFQDNVLPIIFNNSLVVKRKDKASIYKWFEDISSNDNTTKHLVSTYRKAFYNFIYKSRRSAITHNIFHKIMKTSIAHTRQLKAII